MSVSFETHGHEDKFWNLGPMPKRLYEERQAGGRVGPDGQGGAGGARQSWWGGAGRAGGDTT